MNGSKLLVDTNILIYLFSGDKTVLDFLSDKKIIISIITEIELLSFRQFNEYQKSQIKKFIDKIESININSKIKEQTVLSSSKSSLKLPDLIIAATSISEDIPLFTADKDFEKIEDLNLILYNL